MPDLEYTRYIDAEAIYAETQVQVEVLVQPAESVSVRLYAVNQEQIDAVDQSMRLRGFVRVTEVALAEEKV